MVEAAHLLLPPRRGIQIEVASWQHEDGVIDLWETLVAVMADGLEASSLRILGEWFAEATDALTEVQGRT